MTISIISAVPDVPPPHGAVSDNGDIPQAFKAAVFSNQFPGFKIIASAMAERGIPVIPIPPRQKAAQLKDWPERATTDINQIETWHKENPQYNCGAVATRNGFWMLDCDQAGLLERIEKETQRKIPTTLTVRSRKGQHIYFVQTDASRSMGNIRVAGLFDAQVSKRYVVAPGSIHPESLKPYEIIDSSPIVEAPDWLYAWLLEQANTMPVRVAGVLHRTKLVHEGGRNEFLASRAGRMRRAGISPEGLEIELMRLNEESCNPPLHRKEVSTIAKSISRYAPVSDRKCEFPKTDIGNAERFSADHRERVRYCPEFKKWLIWDGTRWKADATGEIYQLAKQTVRSIKTEVENPDEYQQKALNDHGLKSERRERINAMIDLASSESGIPVLSSNLDRDVMLFNLSNGTIELGASTLRKHRRDDLITKIALIEYDPKAGCPLWTQFISDVTGGDVDLQKYLQRAVGYSLTGLTEEHAIFLLYGKGCNGKTTFLETVHHVLGDYAGQADFDTFTTSRRSSGAARNDLAMLRGKRFVKATESEQGTHFAEAFVKNICGGDMVTARFLYGEHFEFKPQFKLWLATNHKPSIVGTDDGIWRRIRLIPFTVCIPEEKKDKKLGEKLKAETNGILLWAIEGLQEYLKDGLPDPSAVKDATAQYRSEQDTIQRFLDEKCVVKEKAAVGAQCLHTTYLEWAHQTSEPVLNITQFGEELQKRDLKRVRSSQGVIWRGIGLMADQPEVEAEAEGIPF
jgi:putative DNA primase/helicase